MSRFAHQGASTPPPPQTGRESLTPWIIGGALFLQTLDATIVTTALPTMARALNEPAIRLNSIITAYLLASAIFIPISGWLADRFGSKPVFRVAILAFTFASLLCGLATTLETLLVARFFQGAAAAMITPVGRLLIVQHHASSDLLKAMASLGIPIVTGPVVGPPLGGLIVQYFSWHWIFLVNIPIGLVMAFLVQRFISDVPSEGVRPLDVRGFLLSGIGAALFVYGLSVASEQGSSLIVSFAAVAAGAMLTIIFVVHARRSSAPILDLSVLRADTFRAALVGSILLRMGAGASLFLLALLLQLQFDMTPLGSGLVTLTVAIAALIMKTTAQPIIKRLGYKRVLIANGVIVSAMLAAWGLLHANTPMSVVVAALLAGGFFRSLQFTALNTLIFADVSSAGLSRASSLAATIQQLADGVGIAVCAIILSIAATHGLDGTLAISMCFAFLSVAHLAALPSFLALDRAAGDALRGR
jgi:EmrB/QacA subfamily drug resistance transporter